MISSRTDPWKSELLSLGKELDLLRVKPKPSFPIERALVYGALCIRKIIEDRNIPDRIRNRSFDFYAYPSREGRSNGTDAIIGMCEDLSIEKLFDFSSPVLEKMDAYNISSELIHSADMALEVSENYVTAIYIASFRNEYKRVLRLKLEDLVEIFMLIGSAAISNKMLELNVSSGNYRVVAE